MHGNVSVEKKRTRERLLDTAEQLFGEHGIEAVSLSRITREAGQRNASALNYYFGSKTELIKAILARRMVGIDRRRLVMLEEVDHPNRLSALRSIVEALVIPLAEQMEDSMSGRHYVRFIAQLHGDPRMRIFKLVRGIHDSGIRKAADLVYALMTDLPREIARQRLVLVTSLIIHAMAEQERAMAAGSSRRPAAVFVSDLIDAIVGLLAAPTSEATRRELAKIDRKSAKVDFSPEGSEGA